MIGCSQDEIENDQEDRIITVSLKLNGEISSNDSPITRTETDSQDLIGITVYKNGNSSNNKFAYGLFDNLDNVTINLLAGAKYYFRCTLIKDAKNKLYKYSGSYSQTCNPFWGTKNGTFIYLNEPFKYSTSFSDNLHQHVTDVNGSTRSCVDVDRFYGELDNYTPTVNGVVNIDLKRVSFGLQVKVTGITDGTVDVTVKHKDANVTFDSQTGIVANYESEAIMYCMYQTYSAWQYADADYQEPINVSVKWTRGVGVTEDLGTKTVNVKRNSMNIIHIKLTANGDGAAVGVREESAAMGNESESLNY